MAIEIPCKENSHNVFTNYWALRDLVHFRDAVAEFLDQQEQPQRSIALLWEMEHAGISQNRDTSNGPEDTQVARVTLTQYAVKAIQQFLILRFQHASY